MEAIVGVWLTSILGAATFSVAGYVAGRCGASLSKGAAARATVTSAPVPEGDRPTPKVPPPSTPAGATSAQDAPTPQPAPVESKTPPAPEASAEPSAKPEDETDRPTLVPATLAQPSTTTTTPTIVPPPTRQPSLADMAAAAAELESLRADVRAALERAENAAQKARAADVVRAELERQIEALRQELKQEVAARATAERRAAELDDRLAAASAEAATLRHRVSSLDKVAKQLREALQGRVRSLTTSAWHRRRDLEEAEAIVQKVRDVSERLERSSLPPNSASIPPSGSASLPPGSVSFGAPAVPRSLRPSIDDAAALREEVARLTAENRSLRARILGSFPPKQQAPRTSGIDLDLDGFRALVDKVGAIAGLRGVALTDDVGALLAGSGEHTEGLAAFGSYIRDASSRTDRLLPLEGVEEVDILDRRGTFLSTRVVAHTPTEICLVLLGAGGASLETAKKLVDDTLRQRS
jgi:signal transduction histidine kinase